VKGFLAEMELVLDKIAPLLHLSSKHPSKKVVLSKKELQILDYLQQFHTAGSKDLATILSLKLRTLQRALKKMTKNGLVKKIGTKKNARYQIRGE
jgi:DNA-binding MarR family transcriptional regulator